MEEVGPVKISKNKDSCGVSTISVIIDDGGDQVELTVDIFDNGDQKDFIYSNFHITTNAHGTSQSRISVYGPGFESIYEAMKKLNEEFVKQGAIRQSQKEKLST